MHNHTQKQNIKNENNITYLQWENINKKLAYLIKAFKR